MAIVVVVLLCGAFMLAIALLSMRASLRIGDETPGWERLHRRLPGYKVAPGDRLPPLGSDASSRASDTEDHEHGEGHPGS